MNSHRTDGVVTHLAPRTAVRRRVLVVDDSHLMRAYYRSILEPEGFEVSEAQNGLEGLEWALRERLDLMIVDINMPKLDGYRLMQQVRNELGLRDLPAIMISTEAGAADKRRALESGANDYLVKPVPPDVLRLHVRMLGGITAT